MKKIISFIVLATIFCYMGYSQTNGTMTFTFTTASAGGYTPKNLIAVWVENGAGTFIKTKLKLSSSGNHDHLATWVGKSGGNTTDATTGPTRTSNGDLTVTWNGTNVAGSVVTDGPYKMWVEFAWASSLTTGKVVQSFAFTKGTSLDHQTFASTTNLLNMIIDWVPSTSGLNENDPSNPKINVYPNPFSTNSTINYYVATPGVVYVAIYNINGQLVKTLMNDWQSAGNSTLEWNGSDNQNNKVANGIYLVKMQIDNKLYTQKVFLNK